MAKALEIQINLPNLGEAVRGINHLGAVVRRVPTAVNFRVPSAAQVTRLGEFTQKLKEAADAYARLGQAAPLPAAPTSRGRASVTPAATGRQQGGAEARLQQAQADLANLRLASYTPAYRLRDAQAAVQRAQANVDRQNRLINPPTLIPTTSRLPGGANALVAQRQQQLQQAQAGGNQGQIDDARAALLRAQQARQRQQDSLRPPSWVDRLGRLIGSTRVNLPGVGGFSASPLVNKTFDLLGIGGTKAQVLATGLGAAAGAVGLFVTGIKLASDRLASFSEASHLSGGTAGQVGALNALGLEPGQIAEVAKAFREQTSIGSGDTFGILGRQKLGLPSALPRQFGGNLNEAGELLQAIRELRRIGKTEGEGAATQLIRQIPTLEQFAGVTRASEEEWRRIEEDMANFQGQIDSGALARGAEAQREFSRATRNLQNTLSGGLSPLLRGASTGLAVFSDLLRDVGSALKATGSFVGWVMKIPDQLSGGLEGLAKRFNLGWLAQLTNGLTRLVMLPLQGLGLIGQSVQRLWNMVHGGNPASSAAASAQANATNANTQAMNNLTQALREGMFGGGARAAGSLPPGLIPYLQVAAAKGSQSEFDSVINGRSLALGAWSL